MAYMNRGDGPSIDNNNSQDNSFNNVHYGPYVHYYVPLDNTYVRMQMVVSLIILIIGAITFVFTYKSTITDPIENVKKTFINTHLITIGILLGITLLAHFFSKKAKLLIKILVVVCSISILSMLIFLGIKLKADTDYNKDKFEQIYVEKNINQPSDTKSKFDIGINGISVKTEKEYYIDECMKLYNIFKIKTCGTLGLNLLLTILLIYEISKISKIVEKKDSINNDDLILFDEERNVKY